MKIEYKITKYFNDNNLFKNNNYEELLIDKNDNAITIKGSAPYLVELADILVSIAKEESKTSHIHLDNSTIISNESEIKEIIIEKI